MENYSLINRQAFHDVPMTRQFPLPILSFYIVDASFSNYVAVFGCITSVPLATFV
jgi:hypothetical protein